MKKNDVLFYVNIAKSIKRLHFRTCFYSQELYGFSDSFYAFFNIQIQACHSLKTIENFLKMYLQRNSGFDENYDKKIYYDEFLYMYLKVNKDNVLTLHSVMSMLLLHHVTKITWNTQLKSTKIRYKNYSSTLESFR